MLVYNKQLIHNCFWKRETYIYTGTWTYCTKMVALPGVSAQEILWFFEIIVQLGMIRRT